MHEILRNLEDGAVVLDLGSGAAGSVPADTYPHLRIICLDCICLDNEAGIENGRFVQGDAASLPFRSQGFDAVIASHSLEHVTGLPAALAEIGRVTRKGGSLYVAVPDSSSLTDRIYRWLFAGGGHVNPISSPGEFETQIAAATGLKPVARRVLYTSLIFLTRYGRETNPSRRLWLFAGGAPWFVASLTYAFRQVDRLFNTRLSIYGWAFYFGEIREPIDTAPWTNVCVCCGMGHSAASLVSTGEVFAVPGFRYYRCAGCRQRNLFSDDRA